MIDWQTGSSDKHNSKMAKTLGLIFSLFDVISAWQVPLAYHSTYVHCTFHGLTDAFFCVSFIFADSKKCWFGGSMW